MAKLLTLFLVLAILGYFKVESSIVMPEMEGKSYNEDAMLTVRQLIEKYGYRGETHMVDTKDGYILGMHRITGPKNDASPKGKQPVLILHPLLGSSADFVITGPGRALGYVLADEGYDVWLGNIRGNNFSRKHKKYTTLDKEYWQFSWHESGVQDLPAMIDFILEKCGRQQLYYIGHSQGSTAFWVMATERPEYQTKVKAVIALAPVAYLTHMKSPFYHAIAKYSNLDMLAKLLGQYEFAPAGNLMKDLEATMCDGESWVQPICTSAIFLIAGPGSNQLNLTMLPTILGHIPAGGSVKQIIHFLQVLKARRFQHYDHGLLGNWEKYKQFSPPTYELSKINVPVYIHYSKNDWLSDPKDIDRLYKELGNSVGKFRVTHEEFSHLDFIWANDSKRLLYNKIIGQLKKYSD